MNLFTLEEASTVYRPGSLLFHSVLLNWDFFTKYLDHDLMKEDIFTHILQCIFLSMQ